VKQLRTAAAFRARFAHQRGQEKDVRSPLVELCNRHFADSQLVFRLRQRWSKRYGVNAAIRRTAGLVLRNGQRNHGEWVGPIRSMGNMLLAPWCATVTRTTGARANVENMAAPQIHTGHAEVAWVPALTTALTPLHCRE
jgi:hypothetical protein